MQIMNKDAPVICAECERVAIKGDSLFCEEKQKLIYGSRPNWCPHPLWIECEEQISFNLKGKNNDKE